MTLQCLCAILWLILFHSIPVAKSLGESCGILDDVDQGPKYHCPTLCVGHCSSSVMQSYTDTDMTEKVYGCTGDGLRSPEGVTNYEENHIIYSKTNRAITKIYLTISEDATRSHSLSSNITRVYNFMLLTTSHTLWIISYQNTTDAKYNFYVRDGSQVQDFYGGNLIKSTNVDFPIVTSSEFEYLYIPLQIRISFCRVMSDFIPSVKRDFKPATAKDFESCSRHITSLLNFNDANSLKIKVGAIPKRGHERQVCDIPNSPNLFNGNINIFKASMLNEYPASQNCSNDASFLLYAIDLANTNRNSTIKLQLFGASLLTTNTTALISLRSKIPVHWQPIEANGYPIIANISFVVSSGSSVNISAIRGSRVLVVDSTLPDRTNDTEMLKKLSSALGHPIKAYTKFNGNPNLVNLKLVESSNIKADGVEELDQDFFYKIHLGFLVSSLKGAQLSISCKTLSVAVKRRRSSEIYFRMEPRKPTELKMTAYRDIMRNTPVESPPLVTEHQNTFFTKVDYPIFKLFGISSKLDHCYLRQNGSNIGSLIQNNCPVSDYTCFLVHGRDSPADSTGFGVSFSPFLSAGVTGLVDLVCDVSKCLEPNPNLTWDSALPKCPSESNVACEERSLATDLYSSVKTVSMSFNLEPGQSSTVIWTSSEKRSSTLQPCKVQQSSCQTWVVLLALLTIIPTVLIVSLVWFRREWLASCFVRLRIVSQKDLEARRSQNNRTDTLNKTPKELRYPVGNGSLSMLNVYEGSVESVHCSGECPLLITDKLAKSMIVDDKAPPLEVLSRSKEDSSSSSSSSDSGVGERKSLVGSTELSPLRESDV